MPNNNTAFPAVMEGTIGSETIQTVNARELHSFLELGVRFNDWVSRRITEYEFEEGKDFYSELSKTTSGGRPSREYHISLDMAKELAMVERNEKGKQARQYFIECERRAKNAVDPVAVLNNPAAMRGLLLTYSEKVIELEGRIEADKPKTQFFDQFMNADGLYGLQNAARALNCRPNLFIRWLKEHYLFYQGGNLVARVQFIQMGIFEVKTTLIDDKVRPQAFITPKGLKYLNERVPDDLRMRGAA
ncbi:antA/AntB antirepressor family protein [Pseudochrobactrum asaccharolyticum]|uniref:Anti-repressor protein n=1 Tax=Pseudochrobactrum asaccharolyticum TaxID=354351 RepID=A0A366DJH6_9HYPH|nr:antA/AntB antirepressor family protein [Pseudochrobactrum asaccharolyticum]RBO89669.1 anti-repressor protein [Pseudochrobactrum asaccharolyticum]